MMYTELRNKYWKDFEVNAPEDNVKLLTSIGVDTDSLLAECFPHPNCDYYGILCEGANAILDKYSIKNRFSLGDESDSLGYVQLNSSYNLMYRKGKMFGSSIIETFYFQHIKPTTATDYKQIDSSVKMLSELNELLNKLKIAWICVF